MSRKALIWAGTGMDIASELNVVMKDDTSEGRKIIQEENEN